MDGIKKAVVTGLLVLLGLFLFTYIPLYVDWLWFKDLGYSAVFTQILTSKLLIGVVTAALFFILVWGNVSYALKTTSARLELYTVDGNLPIFLDKMIRRGVEFMVLFGSITLSIFAGFEAATNWKSWLLFRNGISFGQKDPVFGKDIAFYVFKLDFLTFAYQTVLFALVVAVIATASVLYLTRTVDFVVGKLKITNVAAGQLGMLLALIAFLQAFGFRLSAYKLLYTSGERFYGPGYTDIHVRLLGLDIATVACIVGGTLVIIAAKKHSLPLAVTGLLLGWIVNLAVSAGAGGLVQRLVVQPDELRKETPYIQRHIDATQFAYGLKDVIRKEADLSGRITPADLEKNQVTLQSLRLWDYRPLQAAYTQLQELVQYYSFNEVDIDRYTVKGIYRQVMLSAREMDKAALPVTAQSWVNLRLKYTHGYGIAMSPVNEVSKEGLPQFFIRDIPPSSSVGFKIDRPQIYFGEKTDDYVIVNTKVAEFDYPSGDEGVYRKYTAESGVEVGNIFRRMLLATRFADLNIILPGNLKSDSRILFRRQISRRIKTVAPFLRLDRDPYIVLSGGKLFWIQDAYTETDKYPYSQPAYFMDQAGGTGERTIINYIRNSVKVVTDAYTGRMTYYVFDEKDPIIRAYQKIFPSLFKTVAEMPEDLRKHVRYPEDIFRLQTAIFQNFHVTDVQVFYNKGDVWDIPTLEKSENVGAPEAREPMEPYYIIMKLPDAAKEEMLLLLPFTRAGKRNMVAWMAAKCDENYGQLKLYEFPKGEQFFGPAQIQARANSNTEISEQMTLWNQQKSSVIRGNLLVIPIENSMIYVEPIYLQSTTAKIPELKRVIVAYQDTITMQPTLNESLEVIFGASGARTAGIVSGFRKKRQGEAGVTESITKGDSTDAFEWGRAYELHNRAQQAIKRGDWAEYGALQKQLGNMLRLRSTQVETSADTTEQ